MTKLVILPEVPSEAELRFKTKSWNSQEVRCDPTRMTHPISPLLVSWNLGSGCGSPRGIFIMDLACPVAVALGLLPLPAS